MGLKGLQKQFTFDDLTGDWVNPILACNVKSHIFILQKSTYLKQVEYKNQKNLP